MKESIYRNGGLIQWKDTIGIALAKLRDLKDGVPHFKACLYGEKAFGKSSLLEYYSETEPSINAVEGDIMLMLALAVKERVDESIQLDEWAKSEANPWEKYKGKDDVKIAAVKELPGLDKLNLWTNFYGAPRAKIILLPLPDYDTYVKRMRKRTESMLNSGSEQWKKHVRTTHIPLSYQEFARYIEDFYEKGRDPKGNNFGAIRYAIPNLGIDSILDRAFTDIYRISLAKHSKLLVNQVK